MRKLKKISEGELRKILEEHNEWLSHPSHGKCANLSYMDLQGVNLCRANLQGVNLQNACLLSANLEYINLEDANLVGANLNWANLKNAHLRGANLSYAHLASADLENAHLEEAILLGAKLECANLYHANLKYAMLDLINLEDANLAGADLESINSEHANLRNANLAHANLRGAILKSARLEHAFLHYANLEYINLTDADLDRADLHGAFLSEKDRNRKGIILQKNLKGFKLCKNGLVVELLIPKGSVVFSINGDKCRTNKAKVVSITNIENTRTFKIAESSYKEGFYYQVGKIIEIEDFDLEYNIECTSGIHFFKTRKEAADQYVPEAIKKDTTHELYERFCF